jgi:mannose-1-phosphate guanylyltransferase
MKSFILKGRLNISLQFTNGENLLKALILAGGFGTRLRPISCTRPKILFPIINKPLLQWTFERLAKNNITEAILAVNYQTEVYIKQHKIPKCGLKIKYSRDPIKMPMGTGGAIKKAEKLLGYDSPFLALNGDIFADLSYTEILKKHKEEQAVATIALQKVKDPSRYGVAEVAADNRIKRFIEKPSLKDAPSDLINAGVYVLSPKIFGYIQKGRSVSIEREVFTKLAIEGKLYGHVLEGLWMDIGKPEEYLEINKTLLDSIKNPQESNVFSKIEVKSPVIFGKKVAIGEKSVIGPYAILGQDVIVGKNVRIKDSVVFPSSIIGDSSSINGAIIGESTTIGKEVIVEKGCIIGDFAKINDKISLAQNVSVCPAKEISKSVSISKCVI